MIETHNDTMFYLLIGIVALVVFAFILVALVLFFTQFSKELKYLNNEIRRTDGIEQSHWIKQKKRLWLSLLPFVKY